MPVDRNCDWAKEHVCLSNVRLSGFLVFDIGHFHSDGSLYLEFCHAATQVLAIALWPSCSLLSLASLE